ncbi:unnamed protein product [Orchesella dallaii]|uniref:Polyprenal reductase n=1 Tax=Orchesella dallaii TaxID=48710 RepID=A0ABP1QXE7_9HEXA
MESSINYIQLIFLTIAILTFLPGLITNYAEKCLPSILNQFIRYGRANVAKDGKRPGILKLIEVPKNWFYHSYLFSVFFQSFIILTVLTKYTNYLDISSWLRNTLAVLGGNDRPNTVDAVTTIIAVFLYLFQVGRRLYETLFVCVYSDTKMNVMHYLLAWLHYFGSMLTIVAYSPAFASRASNFDLNISFDKLNLIHVVATLLFFYGSWVQYQAHVGFANLRKDKNKTVVSMKHQIPRGGLFELISCPNYWGEIIVYFAIALLFLFRNYTWNFITIWVVANQLIVGIMNHRWYLSTFPDYPTNRKAVIPFIW